VTTIIAPGAWLGLLGGGQLGRMFCMAAQSLGYKVVVLIRVSQAPLAVSATVISVPITRIRKHSRNSQLAAAATTEFENVPAWRIPRAIATTLSAASVMIARDRISEDVSRRSGFPLSHRLQCCAPKPKRALPIPP
jgi:5-(carboxyamino)imidazole ribonucleotide synthase